MKRVHHYSDTRRGRAGAEPRTRFPALPAVLLAALSLLAACTNPVRPGGHERADGFAILLGGTELVVEDADGVSGALPLLRGQAVGPVTVQFRFRGEAIEPGDDFFLEIEIDDAAVATFTPASPGSFNGTFRGASAGATTMRVKLMHGRVGSIRAHADYSSSPVPIVVAEPS
jgi:hypothetical protein